MQWLRKSKAFLLILLALLMGVVIGGYLFSDTQPRSFLALHKCQDTCSQPKKLVGLLTSVGIQKLPALIPSVVAETEKTVVVEHPAPEARIHYLIFPKKDIKNIADVTESDGEYLVDAFRVVREIVREKNLVKYRVVTNGPGYQGVTYLHFHLIAQ
jgi:histidine triad (HIT) family protein